MADKKISDGTSRAAAALEDDDVFEIENPGEAVQYKTTPLDLASFVLGNIVEKSADPANPSEGRAVIWMSDGTGSGNDGDVLIKITAGGVTKTVKLIDFTAIP